MFFNHLVSAGASSSPWFHRDWSWNLHVDIAADAPRPRAIGPIDGIYGPGIDAIEDL
jgi:hypothetical protein